MVKEVTVNIPNKENLNEEKPKRHYKKRDSKSNNKSDNTDNVAKDISLLIQTTSGICALKLGTIWNISKEESDSIAKPLSNILAKYNLDTTVAGLSDGISLAIATSTVFIPRILMSKATSLKNKKEVISNNGGFTKGKSNSNSEKTIIANNEENIKSNLGTNEKGNKSPNVGYINSIISPIA